MNYMEQFSRDPKVCNGHTIFKGTRVPLQVVLDSLAEGSTTEEILEDYPTLNRENVRAAIAFAARGPEARNRPGPWRFHPGEPYLEE